MKKLSKMKSYISKNKHTDIKPNSNSPNYIAFVIILCIITFSPQSKEDIIFAVMTAWMLGSR